MTIAAILCGMVLLLMGTPLFAMIGVAALLSFREAGVDDSAIFIELFRITSNPTFVAIPLFTFAGFVLAHGRTPQRLLRLSEAFLSGIPGGVCLMVLLACAFFTSFTGASGVTIIALGGLFFPLLLKEGYAEEFSLGLVTSSGSIGLLFAPSLPLILYGLVAQTSIDKLFLAGIVPGFLLIALVFIYSTIKGLGLRAGRAPKPFDAAEAVSALRESIWEVLLPLIILGGIYGGIFTVAEAAAVTAVYVLFVEMLVHRSLRMAELLKLMRDSMVLVGTIIIIFGTARGFTSYLVDEQVPMQLFEWITRYVKDPLTFLMLLNLFLLVVGCLMDIFSAIVVVTPLIVPIARNFGVDMTHLGIIFLTNLEVGYYSPLMGLNLFIASSCFRKPVLSLFYATLPFLGMFLIGLLLITYFPSLSLLLTRLF